MGKQISWNNNTRTINISSAVAGNQTVQDIPSLTSFSSGLLTTIDDPMTTSVMDSHWKLSREDIQNDGYNRVKIGEHDTIELEDVFPNSKCNYTIEYEANGYSLGNIYLGKNGKDRFRILIDQVYYAKDHNELGGVFTCLCSSFGNFCIRK